MVLTPSGQPRSQPSPNSWHNPTLDGTPELEFMTVESLAWALIGALYLAGLATMIWLQRFLARTSGRGSLLDRCAIALLFSFLVTPGLAWLLYLPSSSQTGDRGGLVERWLVQDLPTVFWGSWATSFLLALAGATLFRRRPTRPSGD
jgi:hypothetical protein